MGIFGIDKGILLQQVNCQNLMGAGLAKAIYTKYPIVKEYYHKSFEDNSNLQLFGTYIIIKVEENLSIANLYTQFDCGSDGKVYTDIDKLIKCIFDIAINFPNETIYVPYNIGCGLGGENWKRVITQINDLNLNNIKIIYTLTGEIYSVEEAFHKRNEL